MLPRFLDQWLICGPFFSDRGWATLDEDYLFGESKIRPAVGVRSFGRFWQPYDVADGILEFYSAPFEHNLFCTAYAHTYVFSPEDKDALLLCGSDDGIKVWLNGEVVWRNDVNRACRPGDDTAPIRLKAGWNSVMVKVRQGMAQWQFCVQIADVESAEIPGLKSCRQPDSPIRQPEERSIGVRVRFPVEYYDFDDGRFVRQAQFEVGNTGTVPCKKADIEVVGAGGISIGSLQPGETRTADLKIPFDSVVEIMRRPTASVKPAESWTTGVVLSEPSRMLRDLFAPFVVPKSSGAELPPQMQGFPSRVLSSGPGADYMIVDPPGLRNYLAGLVGRFPMNDFDAGMARDTCRALLDSALAGDVGAFERALKGARLPELEIP